MSAVEKLLNIARNEIGYLEKESNSNLDNKLANAGYKNYTKYARDLDNTIIYNGKKNGYSWCDIFVDWCFVTAFGLKATLEMTYQASKGHGAGCSYSAKCYIDNRRFYVDPQPGDQIFFTKDGGKTYYHTGLVEAVANGRVYTIEGNTSNKTGVIENGGAVASKSYPLNYDKIGGYGRPNYNIIDKTTKPTANAKPKTGKVTALMLNMRSGHSTKDKVIGWLKKDTAVTIISISNDKKWYQIKSSKYPKSGWVSAKYIKVIAMMSNIVNVEYKTTTTALNLRAGRGTTYKALAVIPKNTQVEVSELKNNWYKVKYNDIEGYSDSNYLK